MSDIYELLYCAKGAEYKEEQIKDYSALKKYPHIIKPEGALAGNSRVVGDASREVQQKIIDKIIEVGVRYHLNYREIAYVLLIAKAESGFNPDAAAGTTSASGIAQYTKGNAEEAEKDNYSKDMLGFSLHMVPWPDRFDAEKGVFGLVLSYMVGRNKAKEMAGAHWENYVYIYHHDGWYTHTTPQEAKKLGSYAIAEKKIIPHLDAVEAALKSSTKVSFTLNDTQGTPKANQPYVAIVAAAAPAGKPPSAQKAKEVKVIKGATDGQGKTQPIHVPGVSEIVFAILNPYVVAKTKGVSAIPTVEKHTVKKGETLSSIAKENDMTVDELAELNHIKDKNKLAVGAQLVVNKPHIPRKPEPGLMQKVSTALKVEPEHASTLFEYSRSHVVLPKGSPVQKNAEVKIQAAPKPTKPATPKPELKEHKTNENNDAKPVAVATAKTTAVVTIAKDVAEPDLISEYTRKLVGDVASRIGLDLVIITSGIRPPKRQAKTLYDNIESLGVDKQLKLYAAPGRAVVNVYAELHKKGASRQEIIEAMEDKIDELAKEGKRVSKHCVPEELYKKLNVIDISHSRMPPSRREPFEKEIAALMEKKLINVFISPRMKGGEPAYHLEIPQP